MDDDRHTREGLRDWFQSGGCKVETAADGWQAIQKLKESPFEATIIDLDLPPVHGVAMNGWDLVRISRAFNPAISVVVLTAQEGEEVEAQAEQLKVSELLKKPISPSQLKAIVRTLDS